MPSIRDSLVPTPKGNRYYPFLFYRGKEAYTLSIQYVGYGSNDIPAPSARTQNRFDVSCWESHGDKSVTFFPAFVIEAIGTHLENTGSLLCSPGEAQEIYDTFLEWDRREYVDPGVHFKLRHYRPNNSEGFPERYTLWTVDLYTNEGEFIGEGKISDVNKGNLLDHMERVCPTIPIQK